MREMKDSGVPWIGEIPKEWKLLRNKNAFICSKDIVGEKFASTQLLSLTTKGIKEKSQEATGGKIPESYDTYQTVRKGQLVMCLFDLDCSAVFSGLSSFDGMISPAYKVLDCKSGMDSHFASFWFASVFDGRKFMHYSKNLRYTLTYDEFAGLPLAIPPITEQQRIASFLDAKCAEIDGLVKNAQASIEEYKKLKQAVITEAVTKGIHGERPMKDSGVEWIGEIPEGWMIRPLKSSCRVFGRIGFRGYRAEDLVGSGEGAITLSPSNIINMKMDYKKVSYINWDKYYESPEIMVSKDDILFVKTGSSYGKSAIIKDLPMECTINPQLIVLKDHKDVPDYLIYLFQTPLAKALVEISVVGGTIPTIAQEKVLNYRFPFSTKGEQQEIAAYLDEKCAAIDMLVASKEALVTELESYKKSLIYEYVTGKKEVLAV